MHSVEFRVADIDKAVGENKVRELVQAKLERDFGLLGQHFSALVDEVTASINKILSTPDPNLPPPSASKPSVQRSIYMSRPVWASKLLIVFQPPMRGSVTGDPRWIRHED